LGWAGRLFGRASSVLRERSGKGRAEGISHRLEDVPSMCFYSEAENSVVALEGRAHLLEVSFPAFGAPSISVKRNVTVPEGGFDMPGLLALRSL